MIMLIGGLLLLTALSATFYSSFRGKSDVEVYNQSLVTGTGLAQSLIDEISTKSFDAKTALKSYTTPDSLTSPGSLGPESGETSASQFNDVDDYNNYVRQDTLVMGVFTSKVKVKYAQRMNPNQYSSVRTFSKRIDIYVTNTYLPDTLKMNYIITY